VKRRKEATYTTLDLFAILIFWGLLAAGAVLALEVQNLRLISRVGDLTYENGKLKSLLDQKYTIIIEPSMQAK
jgi:hypothetical protein